jgi:hypothetical protein
LAKLGKPRGLWWLLRRFSYQPHLR